MSDFINLIKIELTTKQSVSTIIRIAEGEGTAKDWICIQCECEGKALQRILFPKNFKDGVSKLKRISVHSIAFGEDKYFEIDSIS